MLLFSSVRKLAAVAAVLVCGVVGSAFAQAPSKPVASPAVTPQPAQLPKPLPAASGKANMPAPRDIARGGGVASSNAMDRAVRNMRGRTLVRQQRVRVSIARTVAVK